MNDQEYMTSTYKITGDNTIIQKLNHITPEVERILIKLNPEIKKGKKSLIDKLTKLALRYPKVPTFKGHIATVHKISGNFDQAYAANHRLLKAHPDYLFGKLGLAVEYLEKGTPEKIPEILGEELQIGLLYPDRDEFHVDEFMSFNNVAIRYYDAMGEPDQVQVRFDHMKDVDPDHPKIQAVEDFMEQRLYDILMERKEEEDKLRISVEVEDRRSARQTTEAPIFNFPENIKWLYEEGMGIDPDKVKELLVLPRKPLIEDLEAVLWDSINRFDMAISEKGQVSNFVDLPTHALLLLAESKASEALDSILEVHRQDEEYLDFYFGDWMDMISLPALFYCGQESLDKMMDFLREPNRYAFAKCFVSEAVIKMGRADESRKEEIVQWCRELLEFYIEKAEDDAYVDTDYLGFLIADLMDAGYSELLPEVKILFDKEIVGFWICGDYEEVAAHFDDNMTRGLQFLEKDIYDLYGEFCELFDDADYNDGQYYNNEIKNKVLENFGVGQKEYGQPIIKDKKVGRNDPCPCGSVKKYKKCCL